MQGKLYGIGVGPGDPELVTLKAARLMRECDVVGMIAANGEKQTAFEIARKAVPEIESKEQLLIDIPMSRDPEVTGRNRDRAGEKIKAVLAQGKDVAFLTLGDPTVYSTYLYLHDQVVQSGFQAEIVPGVTSFCAAAAALGTSLAEGDQPLTIIPGSYACTETMLKAPGNKILMKTGRAFEQVKALLRENGLEKKTQLVERCGMEGERVCRSVEEVTEPPHYFSILLVKPE